jgi:hypothetical protein
MSANFTLSLSTSIVESLAAAIAFMNRDREYRVCRRVVRHPAWAMRSSS